MSHTLGLTQRAVRDWLGDNEVRKGRPYAEDGMVSGLVREGETLKARVRGSRDRPYRVWARVRGGKVTAADCSCPVGDGGGCKHVAAVLLNYLEHPDRVPGIDDLDADLNARDKAELVALIKQMIRRSPGLQQLLTAPVPGFGKAAAASPDVYRRQALDVIREADPHDEWGGDEIADGLAEILDTARQFERRKEFEAAAAVYQGMTAAVVDSEIDYLGGSGDAPDAAGGLADGLVRCLTRLGPGSARREAILRSLHDLLGLNGDLGTDEAGEDRLDALLGAVTPDERRTFAGWLRQSVRGRRGGGFTPEYRSRRAAELLLRVESDVMDDEGFLDHCRRFGLREELVERLIALGRKDEAVREAGRAAKTTHELLSLCHLLARHRLGAEAEQLLRARPGWEKDPSVVQWLRGRAVDRKDPATAAELTDRLMDLWPSAELYFDRKKWTPAATWPATRKAILAGLERRKSLAVLIDILLKEGEVDEAIRVLKLDRFTGRALEVAKAAEATRPEESVRIYRSAAERGIEGRNRDAYREACKHLKRVAGLMGRLGEGAEFQQYVAGLADKYRALRAFQEELRAAKLLAAAPPTAVRLKKPR